MQDGKDKGDGERRANEKSQPGTGGSAAGMVEMVDGDIHTLPLECRDGVGSTARAQKQAKTPWSERQCGR